MVPGIKQLLGKAQYLEFVWKQVVNQIGWPRYHGTITCHGTQWYPVVHFGTVRYTVVPNGTLWYLVIHYGTPWYCAVFCGTL